MKISYFRQSFPDVGQIAGESPLVLVTSDEFVELPRPVNHNVVYIGGLGMDKNKQELNEEFEVHINFLQIDIHFTLIF